MGIAEKLAEKHVMKGDSEWEFGDHEECAECGTDCHSLSMEDRASRSQMIAAINEALEMAAQEAEKLMQSMNSLADKADRMQCGSENLREKADMAEEIAVRIRSLKSTPDPSTNKGEWL